jgi:hypothetical protein
VSICVQHIWKGKQRLVGVVVGNVAPASSWTAGTP